MLRDFTKEPFDIIILAGQSNAEGYGYGPVEDPFEPSDRIFYLDKHFMISHAAEKVIKNEIRSSFVLSFAREYVNSGKLEEGRNLLILRAAVGGTGFSDHRWGMEDDLYLRMMRMIEVSLSLNKENRLVAMLWHQGETDAENGVSYDVHYNNLKNLLLSVRKTYGVEDLPFITGDFLPCWNAMHVEKGTPIREAVRAVVKDCPNCGYVHSDGLISNFQELHRKTFWKDYVHFSRRSLYEFGRRYFARFCEMQQEKNQ